MQKAEREASGCRLVSPQCTAGTLFPVPSSPTITDPPMTYLLAARAPDTRFPLFSMAAVRVETHGPSGPHAALRCRPRSVLGMAISTAGLAPAQ